MVTYIRFERGRHGIVGPIFGPFEWVQLTYGHIRIGPEGEDFAFLDEPGGDWIIYDDVVLPQGHTDRHYSDVIIYHM